MSTTMSLRSSYDKEYKEANTSEQTVALALQSQYSSSSFAYRATSARPYIVFSTPAPIRALFSYFPLLTYPASSSPLENLKTIPASNASTLSLPTLYIFTTIGTDSRQSASFNPTCLKWQTWLLSQGIKFDVRSSNNHASPSGSLPFLIDWKHGKKYSSPRIICASGFVDWAQEMGNELDPGSERAEEDEITFMGLRTSLYLSLIDQSIRPAWVSSR